MNIGNLFFGVSVDEEGFLKSVKSAATKAGDVAGQTMGSRLSMGLNAAAKLGSLALGGAFALATKGAVDLQAAQAKFTAETGLTGAAADAAGRSIAEMSRGNLQNITTIGDVLSGVTKNMGLTGDAADKTAQQILDWSTATGQDAVQATTAWDDTLDSWHLTADQLPGIMDQIIAGTQKFGGTVQGAQAAVIAIAPAIQGLGGDFNDAAAFVNLFEQAGLDASGATRGLQTAIKNLKPGQTLDDLIKQVSSIENPILRSQEAMRIFGTRGGAQLANALHPGIVSLDQFAVSADVSAGATTRAAEAIRGTFTNQVQLAIHNVTSALAEMGQQFGPLVTGFASLASVMGPTLAGIFSKLAGSGPVQAAVKGAGVAVGLMFEGATFIASRFVNAALGVFQALGNPTGPVARAAGLAGGTAGTAFQVAFVAGLAVIGAVILETARSWGVDAVSSIFGQKVVTNEQLAGVRAVAEKYGITFSEAAAAIVAAGGDHDLSAAVVTVMTNGLPAVAQAGAAGGEAYGTAAADAIRASNLAEGALRALFGVAEPIAGAAGTASGKTLDETLVAGVNGPGLAQAQAAFKNLFSGSTPAAAEAGYEAGSALDDNTGQAMRDHAGIITSAAHTIRELIKNGMTPERAQQIALGGKSVQAFQDGMASHKIGVQKTTRSLLLATLAEFKGTSMDKKQAAAYAKLHGLAFSHGISEADIDAEKAGCKLVNHAHDGTNCIPKSTWAAGGASLSRAWGGGFIGTLEGIRRDAIAKIGAIGRSFIPGSPIKEGPLKGIETAGAKLAKAWGDGFIANLGTREITQALSMAIPGGGALSLNVGPAVIHHKHTFEVTGESAKNLHAAGYPLSDIDGLIRNLRRENALPLE